MIDKNSLPKHWELTSLVESVDILDNLRKPINSSERQKRILGKRESDLFPYFGATGQVGWIDQYLTDGEFVLVGEDGAPFLDLLRQKAYLITGKTWVNNHAHILRGKSGITLNKFLLHYLNSLNYSHYVNGTTRLKLTQASLKEIPFLLPPLSEQQQIVKKIEELFSELDKGKQQLETVKQQFTTYRQAVLKWAFEGRFTTNNIKDGQLPEGWRWAKLADVCLKVPTVKRKEKNPKEEFIYLDIGGIDNKIHKIINHKIYNWEDAPSRAQQIVSFGDVLFSTVRTYLENIALVDNRIYDGQIASSGFCVIRGEKKVINQRFIFYYSICQTFLRPLNGLQTGSSYPAVHDKDIFSQLIPLPSISEQQMIVSEIETRLSVCDKMEETIENSLRQVESLRQSILKQAFEGKLL